MDFLIKILLSPVLQLVICCLVLCLSIWLQWRHRHKIAVVSMLFILLLTNKPLADLLAKPLEMQYPPYQGKPPANIIVLGCNHAEASFLPLSSQPELCSVSRLIEAAQLWHRDPTAIVHLSGNIAQRKIAHTEVGRQFLIALGVADSHIRRYPLAQNTREELAVFARVLQHQPAVLVTSAMHMPRAMRWAAFYQLQMRAAPTHFLRRQDQLPSELHAWLPRLSALETYQYLFYEYAGLLKSHEQMQPPSD